MRILANLDPSEEIKTTSGINNDVEFYSVHFYLLTYTCTGEMVHYTVLSKITDKHSALFSGSFFPVSCSEVHCVKKSLYWSFCYQNP